MAAHIVVVISIARIQQTVVAGVNRAGNAALVIMFLGIRRQAGTDEGRYLQNPFDQKDVVSDTDARAGIIRRIIIIVGVVNGECDADLLLLIAAGDGLGFGAGGIKRRQQH